jgi:hypothetical protein
MATSYSPELLKRFRREAKKLGRELSITHSEALDRIAARHGFHNWSLLAKRVESNDARPAPARKPVSAPLTPEPARRYYLHGDVLVDDVARCYCGRCDRFVELSHFDGNGSHGDGEDGKHYLAWISRHNALPLVRKAARGRPDDAPNVLAARARSERETFEASRSPFHRWLEGQCKRDDPVGDLAGDILRDTTFPVALATRREVEAHLSRHGGHIVSAVREAWHEFSASHAGPAA